MNSKEWYYANRSYILNYHRMYRVDNPEKTQEKDRKHHLKHKVYRNKVSLDYYYKNRERLLNKMKENYHNKKKK